MKTFAAFIVALSLFSATAGQAATDAGQAEAARPGFSDVAGISDALRLPGDPVQAGQPERTAFLWLLVWWEVHCRNYPNDNVWCS